MIFLLIFFLVAIIFAFGMGFLAGYHTADKEAESHLSDLQMVKYAAWEASVGQISMHDFGKRVLQVFNR